MGELPPAPEPARLVAAEHDRVGRLRLQHGAQLGGRVDRLVGGDLRPDPAADPREPGDVRGRDRLLDPVQVVRLEPPDRVHRAGHVPRLVRVHPEQRLGPDRLAHRGHDLLVVAVRAADLEVDDAVPFGRQRGRVARELVGRVALREGHEVDLVADASAEEGRRGDAQPLSERVPARDLEPAQDLLRPVRREPPAAVAPELAQDRLHVAGRAADERLRHPAAVGDDRGLVLADRLAVARRARVGLDREEDEVRALLHAGAPVERPLERDRERRRRDGGDLHARLPGPQTEPKVRPSAKREPERAEMSIGGSCPAITCASDSPIAGASLKQWPLPPKAE